MKKQLLLSATAILAGLSFSTAQITVHSHHINSIGNQVVLALDTLPDASITAGGTGSGLSWDFSSLDEDKIDTIHFISPAGIPEADHYPSSNLVLDPSGDDYSWTFLEHTSARLILSGVIEIIFFDGMSDTLWTDHNKTLLTFPSSLDTAYKESWQAGSEAYEFMLDPDGAGPHPQVDSLRTTTTFHTHSQIAGSGTLTLPTGAFDAVRQDVTEIRADSTFMHTMAGWSLLSVDMQAAIFQDDVYLDTTYTYRWWTDDAQVGFPLVSYSLFSYTDEVWVSWVKTVPYLGVENIEASEVSVYPNPTAGILHISLPAEREKLITFRMFDATGKVLMERSFSSHQYELTLTGLPSGFYLYQLLDTEQVVASGKVGIL